MANTSSARKRVRAAQRKHDRNRAVRSAVRTAVVKARRAAGVEEGLELGRLAVSALDKAAEHGVLHPRNAARRKSRLMRLLAATTTAPVAAPAPARRASAQGTRSKSTAAQRKTASGKAKPVTKTVRTAQRSRRSAGGEADRD